jgi:hypothetical protein
MDTETWECPSCGGHNECTPDDFEATCDCGQAVNLAGLDDDGWRIAVEAV